MRRTLYIITIILFTFNLSNGQNCEEGIEVELWNLCYNIEETEELLLNGLDIGGYIPYNIGELVNLQILDLSRNQFEGELPSSIGNLTRLKKLYILGNRLEGSIPESIGNLVQLTHLYAGYNNFAGTIPESLGNLKKLYNLELQDNELSG